MQSLKSRYLPVGLLISLSCLATGCATGAGGARAKSGKFQDVQLASARTQLPAVRIGHETLIAPKLKPSQPVAGPSRTLASIKPAAPVAKPVREVFPAKESEDGEDFLSYIDHLEMADGKVSAFIGEDSLANSKVGLYREAGFREVATHDGTRLIGSSKELARLANKFTDHAFVAADGAMLRFAAVALSQTAADGTITVLVGRGTGVSTAQAQQMGFLRDPRSRDSHGVSMMRAKAADVLTALKQKRHASRASAKKA